jgi:hypothetical protein
VTASHTEFVEHIGKVKLHRALADPQPIADFLVALRLQFACLARAFFQRADLRRTSADASFHVQNHQQSTHAKLKK